MFLEGGWDDDQGADRRPSTRDLGDDESRLDGLAETDLVCNQHTPGPVEDGQHRLELMRQHVHPRIEQRAWRADPGPAREEARPTRQRLLGPHMAPSRLGPHGSSAIEWLEKRASAVPECDVEPDDSTTVQRPLDTPSLLPNPEHRAGCRHEESTIFARWIVERR